jgi:hypothetical protein
MKEQSMTESTITVALVVGDPAHEDLRLSETSLAAAARTIEVHGAVIHGRWDSGRRSTVWCFDIERARAADLKEDLQAVWAGKLESVIWRPVGPAEVIRFS